MLAGIIPRTVPFSASVWNSSAKCFTVMFLVRRSPTYWNTKIDNYSLLRSPVTSCKWWCPATNSHLIDSVTTVKYLGSIRRWRVIFCDNNGTFPLQRIGNCTRQPQRVEMRTWAYIQAPVHPSSPPLSPSSLTPTPYLPNPLRE